MQHQLPHSIAENYRPNLNTADPRKPALSVKTSQGRIEILTHDQTSIHNTQHNQEYKTDVWVWDTSRKLWCQIA